MSEGERLAGLIAAHQPCVALTGAGVSTESGIPDFRSASGLWAEFDPFEYASIDAFRRDPERVWGFYAQRFAALTEAQPNAAHRSLAQLEQRGLLEAVVTQNIDLLHERAGSRDVIEVHGSIRTATCPRCRTTHELAEVLVLLRRQAAPPCRECAAVLKPDVVFFGELLPDGAMQRAIELARRARLLLVVGSSLEVYPVAGLPQETLAAGGRLAIVNRGGSPYDAEAALAIDGGAGDTLAATVAALESR